MCSLQVLGCFHGQVGHHAWGARVARAAARPAGARSHAGAQALRCLHAHAPMINHAC